MKKARSISGMIKKSQAAHRLDKALTELFPYYTRSKIKSFIVNGLVKINGKIAVIPKKKVFGNEHVQIQLGVETTSYLKPQAIPLNIIYEDEDILVINKPHNFVVHPGAGNIDGTVLNGLLYHFPPIANIPRGGIVHRLDKDTSGLMVVAKNLLAQANLIKQLQTRKIIREYEAIVIGNMKKNGIIEQPIARHFTKRICMAINPKGKPATTHYSVIENFRFHTYIRLRLETGRTHQIRVHMLHLNHPLVGDPIYGWKNRSLSLVSNALSALLHNFNRQALQATFLRLYHPVTSVEMTWNAPLQEDMLALITALRNDYKNN